MITDIRMEVKLAGLNAKSAVEVANWVYDKLSEQDDRDIEITVIDWSGNEAGSVRS